LRKLTPRTTAGYAAIEFAETVLGVELYPWQKWLLLHALELLPDGTFRFRTVVLLVARQNGKSTLMQVLSLWRMFVDGAPLVIGTAQNLDVAEEQWQGAVDIVEDIPELAAEVAQVLKVNGKKQLRLTTGERYKVAAASRRGGRGLSGDLVLLDELREHQSWDAWGAVTKTTMARSRAQVWAASNAGDLSSIVLGYLRKIAHDALGNPDGLTESTELPEDDEDDGDSLGIFEWSAPPGCGIWDRDGWAQANPSLGHGGLTEKAIASAARTDPEPVFRTEVLCQWVDGLIESLYGPGRWESRATEDSSIKSGLTIGLAVSLDRSHSAIGSAGRNADGKVHLEPIKSAPGTAWVVGECKRLQAKHGGMVIVDKGGPAGVLLTPLDEAGVRVTEMSTSDACDAAAGLFDAIQEGSVVHLDDPDLNAAVGAAVKRTVGDRWLLGRRGSGDITVLEAVQIAAWGVANAPNYAVEDSFY
jgi:hypothetical protein